MRTFTLALAFVATSCAGQMPLIHLDGSPADLAQLVGNWTGEYISETAIEPQGSIIFNLQAGEEKAFGDVLMTRRGAQRAYEFYDPEHPAGRSLGQAQSLSISFVRAKNGFVTGELDPYWDFDRECQAHTVFRGQIRGNVIEGTYETKFRGPFMSPDRHVARRQVSTAGHQVIATTEVPVSDTLEAPAPVANRSNLRSLFEPRSVAVVGVSQRHKGIGRRVFDRLRESGFPGPVFPITKDGELVDGGPSWTTLRAVREPVDLAVVAVHRDAVLGVIDDCIAASVKSVVIITAGFAEADRAGQALQAELVAKVRAAGIHLIGPNCMGVINANRQHPMNASFSPCFPPAGGLAMSSQSGALGSGDSRPRDEAPRRAVDVRERRQQGRRLRQRSSRVLGR